MSREIILGLAGGDVEELSPLFKAFMRRLGENVGKFKPEWMEALRGSPILDKHADFKDNEDNEDNEEDEEDEGMDSILSPEPLANIGSRGWMTKAVLSVLGHMSMGGPKGGVPPIQAICRAMLGMERNNKCLRTDEDWMLYFLKTFHREQKKYLLRIIGEAGSGELRRRLLKALRLSGMRSLDDMHYGQNSACKMGIDPLKAAGVIGNRAAGGNYRGHEGAMPTVGQLKDMIGDFLDLFPDKAPTFPNWMAISTLVFNLSSSQSPSPGTGEDIDDDRNKGLVPDDDLKEPGKQGELQISHADVSQVRAFVEETISELDGMSFPDGVHGRTFVEFLLFWDKAGEIRATQDEYADRTGVSDGTVAYRRDAIFKALRDNGLDKFDNIAVCEAFKQMEALYLERHLRIFDA